MTPVRMASRSGIWRAASQTVHQHRRRAKSASEIFGLTIGEFEERCSRWRDRSHYHETVSAKHARLSRRSSSAPADCLAATVTWMSEIDAAGGISRQRRVHARATVRHAPLHRRDPSSESLQSIREPKADLRCGRDCLIAFVRATERRLRSTASASDIEYLLATTDPEGESRTIDSGNWFTLNDCCVAPVQFTAADPRD